MPLQSLTHPSYSYGKFDQSLLFSEKCTNPTLHSAQSIRKFGQILPTLIESSFPLLKFFWPIFLSLEESLNDLAHSWKIWAISPAFIESFTIPRHSHKNLANSAHYCRKFNQSCPLSLFSMKHIQHASMLISENFLYPITFKSDFQTPPPFDQKLFTPATVLLGSADPILMQTRFPYSKYQPNNINTDWTIQVSKLHLFMTKKNYI